MPTCPKCGFEADGARECARCGVVFARWRGALAALAHETVPALAVQPEAQPELALLEGSFGADVPRARAAPSIDRAGWIAYGGGLAGALLVLGFPLARAALSGMTTLVHEMGHAAFGWLFGYPSIPAFDFRYGGGVTLQQDRSSLLVAAVLGAGLYGAWALRAHAALRNVLVALLALYLPLAVTGAHEVVIVAMGHGGELFFATLFLHRALSGRGCTLEAERPLYGLLGWFLVLSDAVFTWQLRTSLPLERVILVRRGAGVARRVGRAGAGAVHRSTTGARATR